jgi:hypothetical protein
MPLGKNILTIRGPSQILDRIHDTGLALHHRNDISGNIWLSTYSEMYFGPYIYVLARTPTCLIVSYRSPNGILKSYLEALAYKYRHCFWKNEYSDPSKIDTWMGRMANGRIVEQITEPEDMEDYLVM